MIDSRRLILALVLAALTVTGWRLLLFTTDDAYILFRYASNAMAGHGLVWNAPPFEPVEGYTSFLWLMLLCGAWAVLGVEPPVAANVMSLLLGYGTLWMCWRLASRMELPPRLQPYRLALTTLTLLGIAANRTFLTWLSSGLEASLFVFCFLWWLSLALAPPGRRSPRWLTWLSLSATLMALTRPDGMLAVAATIAIAVQSAATRSKSRARVFAGLWPMAGFAAHLVWRRLYYGEWLPNTYYAKAVSAWPEAGSEYLLSFAIEHGTWLWVLALIAWGVRCMLSGAGSARAMLGDRFAIAVGIAVVVAHFGYYTWRIGGDHFEYRVYAHLVPLQFLSWLWLVTRLFTGGRVITGLLLGFLLIGNTVGWVHYAVTRTHDGGFQPVAEAFPAPLRPIMRRFDRAQAWLEMRYVCVRAQTHGAFVEARLASLPLRSRGLEVSWASRPVQPGSAVGVQAWTMPNVAIIDVHGLNDWVVARTPVEMPPGDAVFTATQMARMFPGFDLDGDARLDAVEIDKALQLVQPHLVDQPDARQTTLEMLIAIHDLDGDGAFDPAEFETVPDSFTTIRRMAHERQPPEGYLEGFRPNVRVADRSFVIDERNPPLTDDDIRANEQRYRQWVRSLR